MKFQQRIPSQDLKNKLKELPRRFFWNAFLQHESRLQKMRECSWSKFVVIRIKLISLSGKIALRRFQNRDFFLTLPKFSPSRKKYQIRSPNVLRFCLEFLSPSKCPLVCLGCREFFLCRQGTVF